MADEIPTGLPETNPVPEKPKYSKLDYIDRATAEARVKMDGLQDPYRQAAPEGFNASADYGGLNFERYYGRDSYRKLGFSPFLDNEDILNKNTTAWDDYHESNKRWWDLAGLGFNSMWSGKTSYDEAREYGRTSNIGSSTRGGAAQTVVNANLNSGYTIGLLSEIALEEIGMGIASFATGTAAAPASMARTAVNAGRAAKVGLSASKFTGRLTSSIKRIKDLKSAVKAESFWKKVGHLGQAVNPLRGTTEFVLQGARHYKKSKLTGRTEQLSALALTSKGFGAFYRDIREVNLAYDEAQLESGFVANTAKNDMIREFMKPIEKGGHGRHPNAKELKEITEQAEISADRALFNNTLLIYATNRMAFGNVFNKYMPKMFAKTSNKVLGGRYVKNFKTGKMEFIKHGGVLGHKTLLNEAKHVFKASTLKRLPLESVKFLGKYSRANFGEGMQEYFQEVIQRAEIGMAKDRYYGGLTGGTWNKILDGEDYINNYTNSLDHFISAEGGEVFASGFIMGVFAGPFSRGSQYATQHLGKAGRYVFDKKAFDAENKHIEERNKKIDENIAKFNELTDSKKSFIKDYVHYLTQQSANKEAMEIAEEEGNKKEFIDVKDKALAEQIIFAQSMGGYDLILQKMKDMAELSEEDLQNAYGGKAEGQENLKEEYKESYDKVIARAESIKELADNFDELFPDPGAYGVDNSDLETGKQLEDIRKARQRVKAITILNQHSLVRTMERMESISKELYGKKAPFWRKDKTPPSSDITRINTTQQIEEELFILNNEIKALKGFDKPDAKQKKDLKYKERLAEDLSNLKQSIKEFSQTLHVSQALHHQQENAKSVADLVIGSLAEYRTGKTSWDGEIIGETTDKKGRPQWIIERSDGKPNSRVLKNSKGLVDKKAQQQPLLDKLAEAEAKADAQLKYDFKTYMKLIAKENNNDIDPAKIDAAYASYRDLHVLGKDVHNLSEFVNMLLDPEGHVALTERYNEAIKRENDNEEETLREQLNLFKDSEEFKKLVEDLYKKHGVFIKQKDLEALRNDDIVPDTLYDAQSTIALREDSKRYKDAQKAIVNWQKYTGRVEEEVEEVKVVEKTKKVEKAEPGVELTIDNFEVWPPHIITQAEAIKESINANMPDGVAIIDDLETWLTKGPGRHTQKIKVLLGNHNKSIVKDEVEEEVETEEAPPTPPKPTKKPGEKGPKKPTTTTGRTIELKISDNSKLMLASEESTRALMPQDMALVKKLEAELKTAGVLDKTEKLDDELVQYKEFSIDTLDRNGQPVSIIFNIEGRVNRMEVGSFDVVAKELGFPETEQGEYKYPVTSNGQTFYASTPTEASWLKGTGTMYVFNVLNVIPIIDTATDDAADLKKWKKEATDRLASKKLDKELEAEHSAIIKENSNRTNKLTSEELQELYDNAKASVKTNLKPSDFIVGEHYKMKGKLSNFGTAVVEKVNKGNKGSVVFISVKTKEKFTVPAKSLASAISEQITDINEDMTEDMTGVTEDEKIVNDGSKTINQEITGAEIEEVHKGNEGKSEIEVADDFFSDAKEDEDNCN